MIDIEKSLSSVIKNLPVFLSSMKVDKKGRYKFSYKGDLYNDYDAWGLGQIVYAAKIYYMLGDNDFIDNHSTELIDRILSFEDANGAFYDKFLLKKGRFKRIKKAFLKRDLRIINTKGQRAAETRQAIDALLSLKSKPKNIFSPVKFEETEVLSYVKNLNWNKPWSSGSHFGHILFYLYINKTLGNLDDLRFRTLVDSLLGFLSGMERKDGFWYLGSPSINEKINGAMKIFRGLRLISRFDFIGKPKAILNASFRHIETSNPCSMVDSLYVIYIIETFLGIKDNRTKDFAKSQIEQYLDYYWADSYGFSFHKEVAARSYYGSPVSHGHPGPDMHGTVMFTWGIVIATRLLKIFPNLRDQIT